MTLSTERAGRRKREILAIARGLFADRGYASTSMRDLAEATGLLPGSLYAHFRSKAEIIRQVLMEFFDDLLVEQQQAFDSGGNGAERFASMIDKVFAVCEKHHEAVRIVHYDWRVLSRLEELEEMRRATDRTLDLWRDVALDGVADGSIDPDIDPEYLMRIATSVVQGVMDPGRYLMRATPTSSLSALDHVKRSLLYGVTTKKVTTKTKVSATGGKRAAAGNVPAKRTRKRVAKATR